MIDTVSHPRNAIVIPLVNSRITPRRLQRISSGIRAKGKVKLSTTWERTRMRIGSKPRPMTTIAGSSVNSRRKKMLKRTCRKPSRIIWPARVPTVEEESPEHKSATAKMVAEAGPSKGPSVRWASSMDMPLRPAPENAAAATMIMAEFTSHAPFFRGEPRLHQAGMQVNDMRHHRGAQHAHGDVDTLSIHHGYCGVVSDLPPVRVHKKDLDQITETNQQNKDNDANFQAPETPQFEGQDGEDARGGDNRGEKHHRGPRKPQMEKVAAEKQVEAERGTKKLSQVGGQRREFRSYPQADRRRPREMFAAVLGQRASCRDAQLGGEVLDEDGHRVRPKQYPEQLVAETRSSLEIGGKISRIDIGNASHEGRAEPIQGAPRLQQGKQRRGLWRRDWKRGWRSGSHGAILGFSG